MTSIKYLLIPFIIFILVIAAIALLTTRSKSSPSSNSNPSVTSPSLFPSPTPYIIDAYPSPTLIPLQFTGADMTKDIPANIKEVSDQKTILRRLTPLTMPFGTVEFDYENDNFLVQLFDPKEESKLQFNAWRTQTYPALSEDKFVIN